MIGRILNKKQLRKRQTIMKSPESDQLDVIKALADIYHTYVLRRYRKFRHGLERGTLRKRRVAECHRKVVGYTEELRRMVTAVERLRKLEEGARKVKRRKAAEVANRIKWQADDAKNICELYKKEIRKGFR